MEEQSAKNQTSAQRFILLTVFIYSVGFGIIMPALPDLIRELEGISLSEATAMGAWIGATYSIFQFLCGPMVGNLGDRFGRRPVFLFSLFFFGLDFLLMGFAPSVIWLFIGRGLAGGLGAIFGPANAAMADMTEGDGRAAAFGKVGAAFGIGFIVGPAIGGLLGDFGTRIPFFVAGALAMANCVYGYFVFPETMREEDRRPFSWQRANPLGALKSLGKIPAILPVALIYFLWSWGGQVYPASWSFFAQAQYGWDVKMVGFSLTIVGISMAIVQALIIGRAVKRFGERKTAMIGMVSGIIGFIALAFISNGTIALAVVLFTGLQGMAMPALNAMMSRRTPPGQQGELQGLNGSMAALSLLIAQLLFNNVLAHYTSEANPVFFPGATFLVAAAIAVVALIALLLLPKADAEEGGV